MHTEARAGFTGDHGLAVSVAAATASHSVKVNVIGTCVCG